MRLGLIIFIRNPELGKVKTRLAKSIGAPAALEVYQKLLAHTRQISTTVTAERHLFYSGTVSRDDDWQEDFFRKSVQQGADLGSRMQSAFSTVFSTGCDAVVIIGSDCPGLRAEIIEAAFQKLTTHDVVLGPATDGGYYLLGIKALHKELFEDKPWSTSNVLKETLKTIDCLCLSYALLPELTDIDEAADLPALALLP